MNKSNLPIHRMDKDAQMTSEVFWVFFFTPLSQLLTEFSLHPERRLTCSGLSTLRIWLSAPLSLFAPLSPAEPSGPGRQLSTGVFIPAVIWASISSKLLRGETKRGPKCGAVHVMDERAKLREAAEAEDLHVPHRML